MRGRSSRLALVVLASLCVGASEGAVATPSPAEKAQAPAAGAADQNDLFKSLALGSGKDPIRIHSDTLELDYKGSTLTYRGSVQVTQGDVTLNSDSLAITFDRTAAGGAKRGKRRGGGTEGDADAATADAKADGKAETSDPPIPGRGDADRIKQVVAEGHVKIRKGDRLAEGRRAVFDQARQTIVLSDGAVLHEGPNQVAGDRIVVYLQEERSVVEGGAKSRVQAVFYPGSSAGEDAAKRLEDGTVARRGERR